MVRAIALAAAPLFFFAPPAKPPPPPPQPLAPLAILPSIARVRIASLGGTAVSVTTEISLPRGDWKGEALKFHVAYGVPAPRAIDAHLVPVGDGSLEPEDDEAGESLVVEHAPRRSGGAHLLLGPREALAGVLVNLPPNVMTKALARGNMASLRIRSVVDATAPDAMGASSLLVRLGATKASMPLTLGRIVAAAPIQRVDARLCGPDADPHALAVGGIPKAPAAAEAPPIAPVLAVRHPTDDLCLRIWIRK
jgi:hypothetical protein